MGASVSRARRAFEGLESAPGFQEDPMSTVAIHDDHLQAHGVPTLPA